MPRGDALQAVASCAADRFPEAKTSIAYGYEYFKHVYPLPVWEAARARAERRQTLALAAE